MFAPRGQLRKVTHVLWNYGDSTIEAPIEEYWLGFATYPDPEGSKRRFIVVAEQFRSQWPPDSFRLECGHEIPIPERHGRRWFNRRKRCFECAIATFSEAQA